MNTHPLVYGFGATFKPIPTLTVSEWASTYRYLPKSGSSSPGLWRNEKTPFLVDIMNSLSPSSPQKEIVFAKGSQIGASESGLNWIMYQIDVSPGPMLAVQPTNKAVERWSKQRVGPSLKQCEKIFDKISWGDGNTIYQKEYVGGMLILTSANSPVDLASMPIANIYFDEIDRYPAEAGDEGDPIGLALRRMSTFPRGKAFYTSTPTVMGISKIWTLFLDSDQRYYYVPCPHCSEYQTITFDKLTWPKGEPDKVALGCEHCGSLIHEHQKTVMLAKGYWKAHNPGNYRVGYHLSSLYSPVGWLSWIEIARDFEKAEGDIEMMKVFTNTILGLPYEESGEQIASEYLLRRSEVYEADVRDDVYYLTLAVDVQQDWLAYEVCGWGVDEESWGIEYGVLKGDISILTSRDESKPSVWDQVEHLRKSIYTKKDGTEMKIVCTVIDSGGWWTDEVYAYTKPRNKLRVFAIKGASTFEKPLMSKPTKNTKNKCWLYSLGVSQDKILVMNRLKKETKGSGFCHFPIGDNRGYTAQYYADLTSEKLITKKEKGVSKRVWFKPDNANNEAFDLRVYGTAAIRIINPKWNRLIQASKFKQRAERAISNETEVIKAVTQPIKRKWKKLPDLKIRKK